jgi:hypothetical protein
VDELSYVSEHNTNAATMEILEANDREGFVDFKIGQVIRTVKYSGDHVLLAKGETVLQGIIDRLSKVGR